MTITRFYSLHYLLPLILLIVIYVHIIGLHRTGGTNPLGININTSMINFNSMYTIKDGLTMIVYMTAITIISLDYYESMIEADNNKRYNNIVTPTKIVPHWYLLPYYSILRCFAVKWIGVFNMLFGIAASLYLELLNMSHIKSNRFKPLNRVILDAYIAVFITSMRLGTYPLVNHYILIALLGVLALYIIIGCIQPIVNTIENYLLLSPKAQ